MSSSPGSSATVDADDSVSLQVSDVKDSILNESEATVDGESFTLDLIRNLRLERSLA